MQFGFYINQKAMVEMALDLNYDDIAVFEFIKSYTHSKKVEKLDVEGELYYWVSWKLIVEELPFLTIKSRYGVIRHINRLIEAGLLKRYENNGASGKSYFAFGDRYDEFEGYAKILNTCCKIATPPVAEMQHNQDTNISVDNIIYNIGESSPQKLPANKFFISSTERAAVLNDPDKIAEIKRGQFYERARHKAKELGMTKEVFLDFVGYWCEHSDGSEKLRCEKEDTFNISRRIETWMKNNRNKSSAPQPQETRHAVPHAWTQEELENLYK